MKICICDDEKSQCDYLRSIIMSTGCHQITEYHSAEELFFECEQGYPFDCIFLDIQMDKVNGIDCARKIRESDHSIRIIFLTALRDYVFEGYEVNAVRYLIKPITQDKCAELLSVIEAEILKKPQYLLAANKKISLDEILYVEAIRHTCCIHAREMIEVSRPFKEIYAELNSDFIMTHRSYAVNLWHVNAIMKNEVIMDDNSHIPLSRSASNKVNEAFIAMIKGGLQ